LIFASRSFSSFLFWLNTKFFRKKSSFIFFFIPHTYLSQKILQEMPEIKPVLAVPTLPPLGRKLLAEWLGTFFLVFVICCVNDLAQKNNQGGLAVGTALTVAVFSLGHISGAHFNPAVTFGAWCAGFVPGKELIAYIVVQLIGGWVGSLIAYSFEGDAEFPVTQPVNDSSSHVFKMFMAEFICTTTLVNAVLQTAYSKQRGNHFFGISIGFTVLASAYAVGKTSGGSFNPAVTTSLMITHAIANSATPLKWWPIYMIAEFFGGFVAFCFFCLMGSYADGEGNADALNEGEKQKLLAPEGGVATETMNSVPE
jgi:aquaporin Z